jgi:membrane associated rhomboid family serine protease
LAILLTLNIVPELILQLSDRGVIEPAYLRPLTYFFGSLQPDFLAEAGPIYFGQNLITFLTYGFLHTGFLHLVVNMIGLVWLGRIILSYRTTETFVIVYLMSMVGAGEAFVLIGPEGGSLVGASGALFGLLGLYAVDNKLIPSGAEQGAAVKLLWLVGATVTLGLADVFSQYVIGIPAAWQAHSGGFLTGALIALISPPRYATAQ